MKRSSDGHDPSESLSRRRPQARNRIIGVKFECSQAAALDLALLDVWLTLGTGSANLQLLLIHDSP
ncbi:MAG: hypothetical protein ACYDCG_06775 [Candidatus Acidiferrales bacterium]